MGESNKLIGCGGVSRLIEMDMEDFQRIQRLPPYIFSITDALKKDARARGEDIIDFGMGNPDQPTPQHIVDKLIETVSRGDTHRYSCLLYTSPSPRD